MLFFCRYLDANSLVVDAADENEARAHARSLVDESPDRIFPIAPGAFALEVAWEPSGEDVEEEEMALEPFEHVADMLEALDDASLDGEPSPETVRPLHVTPLPEICLDEAEGDDGVVYRCHLPGGHRGDHQAHAKDALVAWEQDGESGP